MPSYVTIGGKPYLAYLRDGFAQIDIQTHPTTQAMRASLTKLAPHPSGRVLETFDQIAVPLVPPSDEYTLGEPFENQHWVGIELVKAQPLANRTEDGFVSRMRVTRAEPRASTNNSNGGNYGLTDSNIDSSFFTIDEANSVRSDVDQQGMDSESMGLSEYI